MIKQISLFPYIDIKQQQQSGLQFMIATTKQEMMEVAISEE
jgi:hypothetical protein